MTIPIKFYITWVSPVSIKIFKKTLDDCCSVYFYGVDPSASLTGKAKTLNPIDRHNTGRSKQPADEVPYMFVMPQLIQIINIRRRSTVVINYI